jgi:transcriptional regulator with XRE-family HTH domain
MVTKQQKVGEARARIADNVRRLRNERGLSQEEMAELADFHRTYVSQLERRITNISVDGLERLAIALDVDIVELLGISPGTEDAEATKSTGRKPKRVTK